MLGKVGIEHDCPRTIVGIATRDSGRKTRQGGDVTLTHFQRAGLRCEALDYRNSNLDRAMKTTASPNTQRPMRAAMGHNPAGATLAGRG